MESIYVIEIILVDNEDYHVKNYLKGVTVDSYGIVKTSTTTDPGSAMRFYAVSENDRNSVLRIVQNQYKGSKVSVKQLKYSVE